MVKIPGKTFFDAIYDERLHKLSLDRIIIQFFIDNNIDYCLIGGKALTVYRYERETMDIDFLINENDYIKVKKYLIEKGYQALHNESLSFFNSEAQHQIDLILSGSKYIELFAFPKPAEVSEMIKGVSVITLKNLIRFKIYSGYSMERRMKDWHDVIQLIDINKLKSDFLINEKDEKLKIVYDLAFKQEVKELFNLEDY